MARRRRAVALTLAALLWPLLTLCLGILVVYLTAPGRG